MPSFIAKYAGTARACGHEFRKGDEVFYERGVDGYYCTPCYEAKYGSRGREEKREISTPSPASAIARAHEENMTSAELTRSVLTAQTTALKDLTKVLDSLAHDVRERTRILEEQLKKGG